MASRAGSNPQARPLRVLIVDDSEVVTDRLQAMLREIDQVEVETARRVSQAIAAVRASPPELAILDLVLPEGTSFHLISYVKSISPDTMVIVLTNYTFSSYRELSMENGADHFLDKSLDFDQVVAIVRALAERTK